MIIYKITNKINGKIYIGQTTQSLTKRWGDHCSKGSMCKALSRAIYKYGKHNFKKEIICSALNKKYLNELESYFIKYYNSYGKNGYNLSFGYEGDGAETLKKSVIGHNPKTGKTIVLDRINQCYKLGFDSRTIHKCLNGEHTQHKGYFWFYYNKFTQKNLDKAITTYLNKKILQSKKGSSSQYRGVSFVQHVKKWSAGIKIKGKSYNLGYFNTEEDAKNKYLQQLREVTIGSHT